MEGGRVVGTGRGEEEEGGRGKERRGWWEGEEGEREK